MGPFSLASQKGRRTEEIFHFIFCFHKLFQPQNDAIHAVIQPSGQTSSAEMVCRPSRQSKEEDYPWAGYSGIGKKTKDVQFLEWKDLKIVYKRYASLYFCCAIEPADNELLTLEIIHRYVELLDKYFGSVCELDIIFNFEKAYFMLDELMLGGEVQETSKKNVLKAIAAQDLLQEESEEPKSILEEIGISFPS